MTRLGPRGTSESAGRGPAAPQGSLVALPPDYLAAREGGTYLALHRAFAQRLEAAGYGLHSRGSFRPGEHAGRSPLWELTDARPRLLLRRFSHGGLLRRISGQRFRDPARPFRELCLAAELRARGIDTPLVVAAAARRAPLGWELELVTPEVEGCLDLGALLGGLRRGEIARARLRPILVALGELCARLHQHGFLHADLQPNNVLIAVDALAGAVPRLWILDLDRSRIVAHLEDRERQQNLERLYRFVAGAEARYGQLLTRGDYRAFFAGYDRSGLLWRALWRAVQARYARALPWHRVGRSLERMLGLQRDERRETAALSDSRAAGAAPCAGRPAPPW